MNFLPQVVLEILCFGYFSAFNQKIKNIWFKNRIIKVIIPEMCEVHKDLPTENESRQTLQMISINEIFQKPGPPGFFAA